MRLMQPYGGSDYGLHLPLHASTEVLLACVGGHLDRPVLLGALPNPATPTPVAAANSSQNILRTAAGNELLLDDRKGKEKVELFTAGRRNLLALDADGQGHAVRLATAEGKMEVSAATTALLSSGDTHALQSGADHLITVENACRLTAAEGQIALQAATDIRLNAAENLHLQSEEEDITLHAGENLLLHAGEEMSVEVRSGDLEIVVESGSLTLKAAGAVSIVGEGGGAIRIGQGAGMIEIAPNGDITIEAPEVEIIGETVALQGGQNFQGGGGGWGASLVPAPEDPVAKFFAQPVKPELVIGVFFDGTGKNKDAETAEGLSNVAKLWGLYSSASNRFRIYVAGIGTRAGDIVDPQTGRRELKASKIGMGTGTGPDGGPVRLEEAKAGVLDALKNFTNQYGPPDQITFDVFGFSRGAMLARHFVNMINAGLPDLQGRPAAGSRPIFPDLRETGSAPVMHPQGDEPVGLEPVHLYPTLAANVRVRFLGIFDSVGSFFLPGNDDEGFVNPHLSPASAEFVYHLTARNEIRENYPLTRIAGEGGVCPGNFLEEELFGVHTDVGGGYDSTPEKLFLTTMTYDPPPSFLYDESEPRSTANGSADPAWVAQMQRKAQESGCEVEIKGNTAYFFEVRHTKPELSRVSLHAMHDKAVANGVPFDAVKDTDAVPPDLASLVARAKAHDHEAFRKLDELYIHTSHRQLTLARLNDTIGMQAAKNNFRAYYFNHPERALFPPMGVRKKVHP